MFENGKKKTRSAILFVCLQSVSSIIWIRGNERQKLTQKYYTKTSNLIDVSVDVRKLTKAQVHINNVDNYMLNLYLEDSKLHSYETAKNQQSKKITFLLFTFCCSSIHKESPQQVPLHV